MKISIYCDNHVELTENETLKIKRCFDDLFKCDFNTSFEGNSLCFVDNWTKTARGIKMKAKYRDRIFEAI